MGLTDIPGDVEKVTSDKKIIFMSHQRYMDGNRGYCGYYSLTFETTGKFLIDFVKWILGKVSVEGVTRLRRDIDIRYEFDLKVILKSLGCK